MSKFNQTTTGAMKTVNKCGAPAYKMEDCLKLTTMVLTSMFGEEKYYGDNTSELTKLAESINGEFLAKLAIYTRKVFHLRSVSHALAAIVAHRQDTKIYTMAVLNGVVERVDDITEIMSYYIKKYGKPIPNALKKATAAQLNKFNEYQFAKYNGGSKELKVRDVLRIVHPKPVSAEQSALFKKIITDTLETPYTWETELSARGNTKEVWEELISSGKIGYMALMRNLSNILKSGAENVDTVYKTLVDPEAVHKNKQLPFRYFSAYRALTEHSLCTSKVMSVLESAIKTSCDNMERISGKTLIAVDVSGSMQGQLTSKSTVRYADIGCLIASIANYVCDDSEIVAFDTELKNVTLPQTNGIISNSISMRIDGGGTDILLPIQWALDKKKKFDRIIMISDNQLNSWSTSGYYYNSRYDHRTAQTVVDEYRRTVNPDCWVHAIDLMGYGTQQFIGGKTNILAGWSERVFEFIGHVENGFDSILEKVRETPLE